MDNGQSHHNSEVTRLLDGLNHPFRNEIEKLRHIILMSMPGLSENVKWNGPNYSFDNEDRITMRLHPHKQIQLIFHRGAKKQVQPAQPLIDAPTGLLTWKENDRAVATFKSMADIDNAAPYLARLIRAWIYAAHRSA